MRAIQPTILLTSSVPALEPRPDLPLHGLNVFELMLHLEGSGWQGRIYIKQSRGRGQRPLPFKFGGEKVFWASPGQKTWRAKYLLALATAESHNLSVQHFATDAYYNNVIAGKEHKPRTRMRKAADFQCTGSDVATGDVDGGALARAMAANTVECAESSDDGCDGDDGSADSIHSASSSSGGGSSGGGSGGGSSSSGSGRSSSSSPKLGDQGASPARASDAKGDGRHGEAGGRRPPCLAPEIEGLRDGITQYWYGFRFTPTRTSGEWSGWEVSCTNPSHQAPSKCRRTRDFRRHGGQAMVERALKWWCLATDSVSTRIEHRDLPNEPPEGLPSIEVLEDSAAEQFVHTERSAKRLRVKDLTT